MKPETQLKFEEISKYPFFSTIGNSLPSSVTKANNWQAAAKSCGSQKWEACQLMARNALQRFLEHRSPERIQSWNVLTEELKIQINPFVDGLIVKLPLPEKLLSNIRYNLCWDIMFICLEHEYKDAVKPVFYMPILDCWYAVGHFPCGWDGDRFPDGWDGVIKTGKLIVF